MGLRVVHFILRCAFSTITLRNCDIWSIPFSGRYLFVNTIKKRSAVQVHDIYFKNVQHTIC